MKLFSRIFSMLAVAFAFSVLFCAPTFAEESLSISVDGVAEVEATPNTLETGTVDVYVTSTSRDGYKLSISDSDENNALVSNHGDSINPLAESVTESNFTANAWGVKVGDNFLPVPKLTDNVLELANTTKAATNEKHTVTFGMKVDGTATSGAYSSEVVFTAVANPLVVHKTTLQKGTTVNAAWKTLANNSSTIYTADDNKITSIQKFTGDFTDALRSAAQDIATADSDWPVYTWFDNGTIYYYTEADEVFFNADSSYMFANMRGLTSIDFNFGVETDVDPDGDGFIASAQDPVFITTTATDMQRMFDNARSLVTLDVSKMDVSNVTNMSRMFSYARSLTNLNTTSWNTGKVTDMSYMMYGAGSLQSVDVSHWNVSNVQTMTYMFNSASSLVSLDANNWNTGSVIAMDGMFGACTSLTTLNASNWDTSKVTNMAVMFYQDSALTTLDTSRWDVSKVVTMDSMFWDNSALTSLNTSNWNTGSLVYADSMFRGASSLTTLDVSGWNTSNVTDMGSMFRGASSLTTLDVSGWNTSKVTDMSDMFNSASSLTALDVSNWNTSSVTSMAWMFFSTSSLTSPDVSSWDTGSVTDMSSMFQSASSLTTLDVSNWNTSSVTNMSQMFHNTPSLTSLDVSKWDTSSVTRMETMFSSTPSLTSLDVSKWDTSSVTNIRQMFSGASHLTSLDVSKWDTSKVTDMSNMFNHASALTSLDVSKWDTSKVTDMSNMFNHASALISLDVSNWNTSSVTNMRQMFYNASSLTTIYASDKFNTNAVTDSVKMFTGASKLVGGNGTVYDANHIDKEYARLDKPGTPGYFSEKIVVRKAILKTGSQVNAAWKSLAKGDVATYRVTDTNITSIQKYAGDFTDTIQSIALNIADSNSDCPVWTWFDNGTIYYHTEADEVFLNADSSYMIYALYNLVSADFNFGLATDVDPDGDGIIASRKAPVYITSNVTDMSYMFTSTVALATFDLSRFDTSNVTNMNAMFAGSRIAVGISGWDTSNVTNMTAMFSDIKALETLDVSNWDTSSVTNMSRMFEGSNFSSLDLSGWDTGNVTDMNSMFNYATNLAIVNVSGWDTSNVTNMAAMFNETTALETLDVSHWNTGNVTNMDHMFDRVTTSVLTTLDVSNWNTSSVTDMNYMFYGNSSLSTLDVSHWNTDNVTNMQAMFHGVSSVDVLDVSNWNVSNVTNMSGMFAGAASITSLDVSNWDVRNVTNMDGIFRETSSLTTIDMSNWDTSNVEKTRCMFYQASSLTTIYASDRFVTSAVTNDESMFMGARHLVGGNGTTYNSSHIDKEYARIDRSGTPGYFTEKRRAVRKATLKQGYEINDIWRFTLNADPTSVKRFTGTFTDALQNAATNIAMSTSAYPVYTWNNGSTIYYYTEADEVYLNSDSSYMFAKLSNLRSIDFNFGLESDVDSDGDGYVGFISGPVFITSNVTRMNNMFYHTGITTLDLSDMDTRNVTDMSEMFYGSSSLTTIYASNLFNTNAVTDSGMMFADTTNLIGGNGTTYNSSHKDKEYARIDTATTPGYFTARPAGN